MRPILTVTVNPTLDISLDVQELEPGGKNRASLRSVTPGGGGINVARAVRELGGAEYGGKVTAVHTAGADVGSRLCRLLDGEGLDHVAVAIDGDSREAVVVFETATDRSFHIVPPGPELTSAVADDLLRAVDARIAHHDLVVASGSLPPGLPDDFYARLADAVNDVGAHLVLDTSGPALRPALEVGVHAVKPNRREASALMGQPVETFDDARRFNDEVLARGWAELAATTMGDQGALVSAAGSHHEIRTPPLPGPARSDAGAGDSFLAALTLGLGSGLDAGEAGRWAVAAAAAAVLNPGTELCRRHDVERLRPGVPVSSTEMATSTEEERR